MGLCAVNVMDGLLMRGGSGGSSGKRFIKKDNLKRLESQAASAWAKLKALKHLEERAM